MVDSGRVLRSAFWSSLEAGGLTIMSFVALIVYTRLLSPGEMGLFAVVLAVTELLALAIGMLFHDALVQKPDAGDLDYDTAFTSAMALSTVLFALCFFGQGFISAWVHDADAGWIIAWMAVAFPLTGFSATIIARQRRELQFRSLALRSLVGRLSGGAVGISLAFSGFGLWALVAQQLVMTGASTAVLWLMCDKRPRLRFDWRTFTSLLHFSVGTFAALFMSFAVKRVFIILVGLYLGVRSAGYVNVAFRTMDTLWSVSSVAIQQVALPMLSRLQGDTVRLRRAYGAAVEISCTLVYPCFIGLALTAPEVVSMLFGPRWLPAAPYLTTICFIVLLQVPRNFAGTMLTASGRPYDQLPSLCIQAIFLTLAIALFGIPYAGWAVGLWVGCEIVAGPVAAFVLWKRTGLDFLDQVRGTLTPMVASLAMATAIFCVKTVVPMEVQNVVRFVAFVLTGVVTYGVTLLFFDRQLVMVTYHRLSKAVAR